MHKRPIICSLAALLLAAVGIASAQDAYTTRPKSVRAGPNQDYPLVAELDAGAPLDVHGCLSDWSWCDVSFADDGRGWIYTDGVSFVYQGERVPLYTYAPSLGLTVITFSLGSYWGDYYRGRPWYSQRDQWEHRRLPEHTRPAGRPHEGPPPGRNASASPERHERSQPNERPQPNERSHTNERPEPMAHASPSMPRERPSVGGHQESRSEERGGAAAPGRGAQQPQRTRSMQSGHAASSHAKSAHGDQHEKEHPPQDPR